MASATASDVPQVNEWGNNLQLAVEENRALSQEVEKRFSPVLRAVAPQANGQAGPPKTVLVPLAECLRHAVELIGESNLRLREMLARAEI